MNELQLFNFNGSNVRTLLIDDEPYFVGKDVAEVLGYKDVNRAINQHVEKDERKSLSRKNSGDSYVSLWGPNDYTNKTVINESGVYSLIFSSELPQAKEFKRWVTSEVLPSLRKNGVAMTDNFAQALTSGNVNMADLLIMAGEQLKQKELIIKEKEEVIEKQDQELFVSRPKVEYHDDVLNSELVMTTTDMAKSFGMSSAIELNKILADYKIQYKQSGHWVLYAKYVNKGYAKLITTRQGYKQLKWTEVGRKFIYELLIGEGVI